MQTYSLKQAARHTKIPATALKRACEEELIKAIRLPNGGWLIEESALQEALRQGIDLTGLSKTKRSGGKKQQQPEALRKYQASAKQAAKKAA